MRQSATPPNERQSGSGPLPYQQKTPSRPMFYRASRGPTTARNPARAAASMFRTQARKPESSTNRNACVSCRLLRARLYSEAASLTGAGDGSDAGDDFQRDHGSMMPQTSNARLVVSVPPDYGYLPFPGVLKRWAAEITAGHGS